VVDGGRGGAWGGGGCGAWGGGAWRELVTTASSAAPFDPCKSPWCSAGDLFAMTACTSGAHCPRSTFGRAVKRATMATEARQNPTTGPSPRLDFPILGILGLRSTKKVIRQVIHADDSPGVAKKSYLGTFERLTTVAPPSDHDVVLITNAHGCC